MVGGSCQARFDAGAVDLDLVELCADLGGGQCAIGSEVDQTRLLLIEFLEPPGQRRMRFVGIALRVGQSGIEPFTTLAGEVFAQLEGDVVIGDGLLYPGHGDVRQVAESLLS